MSGAERGGPIVTTAGQHMQQTETRLAMEERRQRVQTASDILGPLFGPNAVTINDSLGSNLFGFNGYFMVEPGTVDSPDDTLWWIGQSIAQQGIGGVQILHTFESGDAPHQRAMRGWSIVPGSGGMRTFSPWEIVPVTPEDNPSSVANVAALPAVGLFRGQQIYVEDIDTIVYWNDTAGEWDGYWKSYVPAWTGNTTNPVINNGTITGKYMRVGKKVDFWIEIVMGTTTTFGSGGWRVTLPPVTEVAHRWTFQGTIYNGSFYDMIAHRNVAGLLVLFVDNTVAGGQQRNVTSTAPVSFGSADTVFISGSYEAA